MVELFLVRHGIALPHGTPDMSDDERPLTDEGEKEVRKVGKGLVRLKVAPDRIVTSPLPRARRTAEIVADRMGLESALEDADALRAGRSAESIRDWLKERTESSLMIVGHDPAFSDLIGLLVTGQRGPTLCYLDKAGVAAFETGMGGEMVIRWIATPKLLRKLG